MRKVFGIGETVLDIIFKGNQPVSAVPGGSTFNSMISLGRSGVPCRFISETGDDRVGQMIVDFLSENGVDNSLVSRFKGTKSPLSLAFLDEQNNANYVFYKDHDADQVRFDLPAIEPGDLVLFGSFYALNPKIRAQVGGFLRHARAQGAVLYYDVNFRDSHRDDLPRIRPNLLENFRLAHIVRGSDEDFQILFGCTSGEEVYEKYLSHYCPQLIYTRGDKPVQVFGRGGLRLEHAFAPVEAVSTIGAGDNFNAGFLYGLIKTGLSTSEIERGLSAEQWKPCLESGAAFSAECCQSMFNYVSETFGKRAAEAIEG